FVIFIYDHQYPSLHRFATTLHPVLPLMGMEPSVSRPEGRHRLILHLKPLPYRRPSRTPFEWVKGVRLSPLL
ncbi:hypothetical protein H0H93_002511, partial [Arthromyces matolae]